MFNIIHFKKSLFVNKELLGTSISFFINGYNAKLLFPNIKAIYSNAEEAFKDNNDKLIKPNDGRKETVVGTNGKEIIWGTLQSYPHLCSFIYYAELVVDVDIESISDDGFDKLIESLDKWTDRFYEYCITCTNFKHNKEKNDEKDCVLGFYNGKYYNFYRNKVIELEMPGTENAITKAQIEEAIKYACSEKEIFYKYKMLRSAIENSGYDNRKAVLDGSAALELCYVEELGKLCKTKGLNSETLLRKYGTLGKRERLFKELGQRIDFINTKNAIDLRNNVMHNYPEEAYLPSDKEVEYFLKIVGEVLKHFHKTYY